MIPKIKFWADVHIEKSVNKVNHPGEIYNFFILDFLLNQAEADKVDWIICLGDFFDDHGDMNALLMNAVKTKFINFVKKTKIKIIFLTGNHEYVYQGKDPSSFGHSSVTAVFDHLEHYGIFVIDNEAKYVPLNDEYVFLGMPYRLSYDHFLKTCFDPIKRDESVYRNYKKIIGWHVGLPFGEDYEIFQGDEDSNKWINKDSEEIKYLLNLSVDKTIYCGHYHGPSRKIPCGDGFFLYIGSPLSSSTAESNQIKRTLNWSNDGILEARPTGLNIHKKVFSFEDALEYQRKMESVFGEKIFLFTKLVLDLEGQEISERDVQLLENEFNQKIKGIKVLNQPVRTLKTLNEDLSKKLQDPNSQFTQKDAQLELVRRAIFQHFLAKKDLNTSLSRAELSEMFKKLNFEILEIYLTEPLDKKIYSHQNYTVEELINLEWKKLREEFGEKTEKLIKLFEDSSDKELLLSLILTDKTLSQIITAVT